MYNVSGSEAPLPELVEEQSPARNYQMDLNSVPFCYSFILVCRTQTRAPRTVLSTIAFPLLVCRTQTRAPRTVLSTVAFPQLVWRVPSFQGLSIWLCK